MVRNWPGYGMLARLIVPIVIVGALVLSAGPARVAATPRHTMPLSNQLRISQVYGGGGNTGAPYRNDFIGIYNSGSSSVSLDGWTVQYASSTGSTWQSTALAGSLGAGQYYLIQEGSGGGNGVPLPTPDATGSIAMSASAGKVALVNNATLLSGTCPTGAQIIDFVGYGSATNCFEGTGAAPTLSNTTADFRADDGCTDTDDNSSDFSAASPNPRNTSSPRKTCVDLPPTVVSTTPADGATGVAVDANLVVEFSEPVTVVDPWYTIQCTISGAHTAVVSGGGTTFTLDPATNFRGSDHCDVTIYANKVTDQDGTPDPMAANYVWHFDVVPEVAPSVSSTNPPNGATGVQPAANLVANFSENVNVAGTWYNINCSSSGNHTAVVSGGPQGFTLNPNVDFTPLESCTAVIYAAQVTDQDLDDPPDNMSADYSWSFTVGTPAPSPCGSPLTHIYEIQGSGSSSSMQGVQVTTEGIVTGDFQDATTQLGGFFVQDPWTDNDPATSDGIFVLYNRTNVNVGNHVRLTGTVTEYNSQTRLTSVDRTSFQVCGTGYSIAVTGVTLPVPANDNLYLEKYEGMLTAWPQLLYVTENYNLGRYGEVLLSSGSRLWQPTNVVLPGAAAVALQAENDRNQVILDDDNVWQNVDPIDHPTPGLTAANTLRSGDTVTGLVGILSYEYDGYNNTTPYGSLAYRIHPTTPPPFVHANPRTAAPASTRGTITVASFNTLNYFSTIHVAGQYDCGPTGGLECRGADSTQEFTRQRNKTIPAIVGLNADVMGLMELENNPTDAALTDLVNGLNAYAGPGTFAKITTSPLTIGSDAIKVALIYRPGRVTPVGAAMVDNDSINSRPTLAQTFRQNSTGDKFTVVVNHLKSKGCSGATGLDTDQGDGQSCFNYTRVQQATRLNTWVNGTVIPTSGDPDVILIGDFNAYALEDPITTLTGLGYTNLTNQFEGTYAYSYVYMGMSGYLDHALATASLAPQVPNTVHWHINPDEPSILDYNTEYKSTGQLTTLYNADPYRSSDHDPVLIGLFPFDFSDLATSYGTAWHSGGGTLRLGVGWTADPTFGLDTDNSTDDGMTMDPTTGWEEGATVRIYAQVAGGNGYLAGWFDWNNDGDFGDAQEKSVARTVSAGSNTINFTIPTGAGYNTPGRDVFVRFRLYSSEPMALGTETPTGAGVGGETEDSRWTPPVPTAVELTSFAAQPALDGILITWETASERDNVGFYLYRSTSLDSLGQMLGDSIIPSRAPGSGEGASYEFLDGTALPGLTYYYTLEDVDTSGQRTAHGPVATGAWRAYLPVVYR